ncbi:MAG: caspase family protein, partial [Opitutales bacterium]|nr:caspase family protein [Opitutales bacterium]
MKRHALIIGINHYTDPTIQSLRFAEQDATEVYGWLKHRMAFDEATLLAGSQAEEEAIIAALHALSGDLGPEDLFVLYFAGHGVEDRNEHWLLTGCAQVARLKWHKAMVSVGEIREASVGRGCGRLLVLDACRNALRRGLRLAEAPGQSTRSLRDLLGRPTGDVEEGPLGILCACDEKQTALELEERRQGVFTAALLEEFAACGRGGFAFGADVCVRLEERMRRLCGGAHRQRPWFQCTGVLPPLFEEGGGAPFVSAVIPRPPPAETQWHVHIDGRREI